MNTGFLCDEASILFNARCIAEDLRDEHGRFLPLFFEAFGEFKTPIYIYLTAVFEFLLGGDPHLIARLPSALGVGAFLFSLFYLLRQQISSGCGLFGVILVSLQPWVNHLSQIGLELVLTPLFLSLGLMLLLKSTARTWGWMSLSALMFSLAFYNYSPARVFLCLLLPSAFLADLKNMRVSPSARVGWVVFASVLALSLIPFCYYATTEDIFSRAHQLNIFTGRNIALSSGFEWLSSLSPGLAKEILEGNEYVLKGSIFVLHYASYYSPSHLFLAFDRGCWVSFPGFGIFNAASILGFTVGVALAARSRSYFHVMLLLWTLFYAIPGAATWEGIPHSGRGVVAHPGLDILIVLGWWEILRFASGFTGWRKLVSVSAAIAVLATNVYAAAWMVSFQNSRHASPGMGWMHYGMREMMEYIEHERYRYNSVFVVGTRFYYAPEVFAAVYSRAKGSDLRRHGRLPWGIEVLTKPPSADQMEPGALYIYAPDEKHGVKGMRLVRNFKRPDNKWYFAAYVYLPDK